MFVRTVLLAALAFAGLWPSSADAASREKVRLILLDKCVADQWKVRKVKAKIVDDCKCASARVAREIGDSQVTAFKETNPTEPSDLWAQATKACFSKSTS